MGMNLDLANGDDWEQKMWQSTNTVLKQNFPVKHFESIWTPDKDQLNERILMEEPIVWDWFWEWYRTVEINMFKSNLIHKLLNKYIRKTWSQIISFLFT